MGRRIKKEGNKQRGDQRKRTAPESKARSGLPKPSSIVSEKTFTSPRGSRYRIITTSEQDPYDEPSVPSGKTDDEK